jgi:hypothetical protein
MRSLPEPSRLPDPGQIHSIPALSARRWGLLAVGLLLGATLLAAPPSSGSYVLSRQVIAGGGKASSGGNYTLVGTVGQSVAGRTALGSTEVQQGFHDKRATAPDELFYNGFE